MSDLVTKLDNLSPGEDRSKMFGYIWRTKQKKNYFACKNNYFVVPDVRGSALVLCRKVKKNDEGYICLKCTDMTVFKNLGNIKNFEALKKEYCDHARLCTVLFDKVGVSPDKTQDKNEVEVLKSSSEFLVHPADISKKLPGVVVISRQATKPKCHTCQGKKCVHVNR